MPKMLILRGNSAPAGSYPDERGKAIAWPIGALHVSAASDYARRRGYDPVVLDKPGQPQSQHSPQATSALHAFHSDEAVAAFYGFSGGGYNLKFILDYLAENEPQSLHRIALVVVIGSPYKHGGKNHYMPSNYNGGVRKKVKDWKQTGRWSSEPTRIKRRCRKARAHTCLARMSCSGVGLNEDN
jgi:hypothetical protein